MGKKSSNTLANLIDWYINKLNKMKLVPVNAAAMLRDVSSKQLSDGSFSPRPLTIDNFTDAELDAIHRLSYDPESKGYKAITQDSYSNAGKSVDFKYPSRESLGLLEYMSPLRSVSTTIGRATVSPKGTDHVLSDAYDSDKMKIIHRKGRFGDYYSTGKEIIRPEQFEQGIKHMNQDIDHPYGKVRSYAFRLGHSGDDPDSQKVRTSLSMKEIREKLGDKLGKMDILSPMSKKEFIMKSLGAGAVTGAPIGAALGALSGAMMLISKKRRKKWLKTMLFHILGGAAIASALGAAGGGLASKSFIDRFEKKSAVKDVHKKKNRKDLIKDAVLMSVAYGVPIMALAGSALYAKNRYDHMVSDMFKAPDAKDILKIENVA